MVRAAIIGTMFKIALIFLGRSLTSTVFKAGHHGSSSSSSRAFLEVVQPRINFISTGKENRYDHPHREVLQRTEEVEATILLTDEWVPLRSSATAAVIGENLIADDLVTIPSYLCPGKVAWIIFVSETTKRLVL